MINQDSESRKATFHLVRLVISRRSLSRCESGPPTVMIPEGYVPRSDIAVMLLIYGNCRIDPFLQSNILQILCLNYRHLQRSASEMGSCREVTIYKTESLAVCTILKSGIKQPVMAKTSINP